MLKNHYLIKFNDSLKTVIILFLFTIVLINLYSLNTDVDNGVGVKFLGSNKNRNHCAKTTNKSLTTIFNNDFSKHYLANNDNIDDNATLMDMVNFEFLINHPNQCHNQRDNLTNDIFMIIFVHSAPENVRKRNFIRKTWGNRKLWPLYQVRLVFMIGIRSDTKIGEQIFNESEKFGDIIQGNFIDTYHNLTYKHLMGLKWISNYCLNTQYVLKTDDDIFIDLHQLVYFLRGKFGDDPRQLMACYLNTHARVSRSYRNKWRVSYKDYPMNYYPKYCSGWIVIMSPDVVINLNRISSTRPFFWIDDVFVTGILAQDLNIHHYDLGEVILRFDEKQVKTWLNNVSSPTLPPMMSLIDWDIAKILILWNKTIDYYQTNFNINLN